MSQLENIRAPSSQQWCCIRHMGKGIFLSNGMKNQINRPGGNCRVDWLDLWQTAQELFFFKWSGHLMWYFWKHIGTFVWTTIAELLGGVRGPEGKRTWLRSHRAWLYRKKKASCFPGLFHLDDWGGMKNSPRALATIHHLPLKNECFPCSIVVVCTAKCWVFFFCPCCLGFFWHLIIKGGSTSLFLWGNGAGWLNGLISTLFHCSCCSNSNCWQFAFSEQWELGCAEGLQAGFLPCPGSHHAVQWQKPLEILSWPCRWMEMFSHFPASVSKLIAIPRSWILITFLCLGIIWTFNERLVRREGEGVFITAEEKGRLCCQGMWAPSSATLRQTCFPLTIGTAAASFGLREWANLAHFVVDFPHMLIPGSRVLLCRDGFYKSSLILKFDGISFTLWEKGWRGEDTSLTNISHLVMWWVDPLVYRQG